MKKAKKELSKFKVSVIKKMLKDAQEEFSDNYLILVVPKYIAKPFQSYCSMREDLKLIVEYLDLLEKGGIGKTIASSLMYSTISLYGKCFTDASKTKAPKLEPNEIFKDSDFLKMHNYMMELRHRFISHRGETDSEIELSYFLMEKEGSETRVEFMSNKQASFTKKEIEEIRNLISYIDGKLNAKIQKAGKRIRKNLLTLDPKIISMMNINNMKEE